MFRAVLRIQGVKYQSKTAKNILLQKQKSELLKKREIIKNSSFLNVTSFRIKKCKKMKQKI